MNTLDHDNPVKVFGLSAVRGRWLFIPLGMAVLLCLGTVYSWSIFRKPLETELGISATESLLPYTVALVCYAILMPIAGFFIPRIGPRLVAAIGGLVVGLGYILASFAGHIGAITLTYGVINGTGVGLAYGVPMVVAARWFPERKGLAVGLTIVGFGLSPLITAPLANRLIESLGVRPTLRVLGIAFAVVIVAIATTLKLPPRHWHPARGNQPQRVAPIPHPYPPHLLKSRSFYGLWICYIIGALVGLSAIGISSPVGEEIIQINSTVAASSVALFALFNGVSRPLFGWLTDRYRPHQVAIASYGLILVACILMVNAQAGQVLTYLTAFSLFWFCLGGWLAIAPTTTLRLFDPEHYAQNYGIVFTAYGIGALLGTLIAGQIRDWFGSYSYAFYPMALLAIVGMVVATLMLKPDPVARR
ncbi:MAG TPA: OFA family MFS transporter [Leptolyngbyaceae cyanobacterium M65_K2018_010]|nr:OFA family MFS transporter [Leptolyngbyaceae cyanobacterium M65_K2018_010]